MVNAVIGTPVTVLLRGKWTFKDEAQAVAAISPGHILERNGAKVQVHSGADGVATPLFVARRNQAASGDLTRDYLVDEQVMFASPDTGAQVNMLVLNGTAAIADGALVASNGDGTVRTAASGAGVPTDGIIIGRALEAVDNSGGSVPVRIKVEVV